MQTDHTRCRTFPTASSCKKFGRRVTLHETLRTKHKKISINYDKLVYKKKTEPIRMLKSNFETTKQRIDGDLPKNNVDLAHAYDWFFKVVVGQDISAHEVGINWIAVDISIGRVIAMVTVSFPQEQIGVSVDIQADRFFSVREVGARVHVDDRRFQSRHVRLGAAEVENRVHGVVVAG